MRYVLTEIGQKLPKATQAKVGDLAMTNAWAREGFIPMRLEWGSFWIVGAATHILDFSDEEGT